MSILLLVFYFIYRSVGVIFLGSSQKDAADDKDYFASSRMLFANNLYTDRYESTGPTIKYVKWVSIHIKAVLVTSVAIRNSLEKPKRVNQVEVTVLLSVD